MNIFIHYGGLIMLRLFICWISMSMQLSFDEIIQWKETFAFKTWFQ